MKYAILLLVAISIAAGLFAQSKKNATYIGFSPAVTAPFYLSKASIRSVKIGLPTFSYAASIERRFSIHNKLNFSFQYALNYYRLTNEKTATTNYYLKNKSAALGSSISINSLYDVNKRTAVYAGVGIDKVATTYFNAKTNLAESGKMFTLKDFNPSLILGIENNTKIFNRNLYYSLQYNIGFFPYSHALRTESETETPNFSQGVRFGLKYKY